ncbi:hypothetical protein IAR55_001030 [Kwoniella newhampshirensis]|uniref:Chloride channel, nucleotide-sensitive, 1A n=1 Tax=Kwoniella newhampshirensis TaxID=1651941 RepID=A0AAW0Z529_9TREE
MLSPLNSPPTSISPEEHAQLTSSTPSSFIDIPPVLRWSDQVEVTMSPTHRGWESWPAGPVSGTLYVTEDAVAFLPSGGISPGFNLPFPALTLHALTPANGSDPAHLYCQIDESDAVVGESSTIHANGGGAAHHLNGDGGEDSEMDGQQEDEDEEADEGEEEGGEEFTELREVRIFLSESKLEPLFQALSSCSALHASLLPNGEPSSFFGFNADDDDDDDGQWEDADEDDDGGNGQGRVRSDFHSGGGPGARFRPY